MSTPTKLLAISELSVGESKCIKIGEKEIALFRQADGFFALDNACPHRGGPLSEGFIENGVVTCPWHQWQFHLKDGVCSFPGKKTGSYPVEIKNDAAWITL